MLRATRGLTLAALGAIVLLCLSFGFGDVSDQRLVLSLRVVLWCALAFGLVLAVRLHAWPPLAVAAPALIWLAVLTGSALAAPEHRDAALATLMRPLTGLLLATSVYAVAASRTRWLTVNMALAAGGVLIAVLGLADVIGVVPVRQWLATLHDGQVPIADVPRLASALSHPNVAASVLELTVPLTFAAAVSAPRHWRPLIAGLLLLHLAALTLTFSRAAVLGAVIGLGVLLAIAARRGARHVLAPIGFAALAAPIGLGLAAASQPQVAHRLLAELEQTGYRATYVAPSTLTVGPDEVVEVPVTVTNVSGSDWTALDDSRVALGYHLLRADGTPLEFDCPATLLPADVPPNGSLSMLAQLRTPPSAGTYLVQWDALREGVAWFSWRGSPTMATSLVVEPSASTTAVAAPSDEVAMPRPARIQYWLAAWDMLRDFPLLGVGPDNFRLRFTDYTGSDESHVGTHAHSLYFESLADTGVLGFVAFSGFLVMLVRYVGRGIPEHREWLWRAALLASLTAWLVHGLLDDFERFLPTHLAFWLIVGLAVRGASGSTERAERPQ